MKLAKGMHQLLAVFQNAYIQSQRFSINRLRIPPKESDETRCSLEIERIVLTLG